MTTSSTARAPTAPISSWNIINLLAYFANAAIVFTVGVSGILGKGNNAQLSAKYQTLITPAGWAFSIWGVIFITQFIWAILQLAWPRYRIKAMQVVHNYNYVLVCLAQIGWTIAFGLDIIWLSMIFMSLILLFLIRIVYQARRLQSQHFETAWCEEYFLLEFPFTIHAGWIMAATLLNANVVLVAYYPNARFEFVAALVSLILVLVASSVFLAIPDFTIPLVLIWALSGIYSELGNPPASITAKFTNRTVPFVQKASLIAIIAIAASVLVRLFTSWREYRRTSSPGAGHNNRSLQEPLSPSGTTAKHTKETSMM